MNTLGYIFIGLILLYFIFGYMAFPYNLNKIKTAILNRVMRK
jgi:hypothetical protein